jgi:hypothetical protein
MDFLNALMAATPTTAVIIVIAYFLKVYLDKRVEGLAGRLDQIAQTSLDLKKGLRDEERTELVDFRVKIAEWEDFLQNVAFNYTMLPAAAASIEDIAQRDAEFFLKVKVAVVRVGIYLRDQQLEAELMQTVTNLRHAYYPLIFEALPKLIDAQTRLMPLQAKKSAYEKSNMTDLTVALTEQDRDDYAAADAQLTAELKQYSDELVKAYPPIAEDLNKLKEAINVYIYRPIHHTAVDKE